MDAALELYDEGGLPAVTAGALTERAGASVGSLYHHFGNLDGVLAALYQETLLRYREGIFAALDDAGDEARTLIFALVHHHLQWVEDHPAAARFLIELRFSEATRPVEEELRRSTTGFLLGVKKRIDPALARGEVRELPVALYPALLLGPAQELCRHWLTGRTRGLKKLSDAADILAEAAWQALRAHPAND